MEILDDTNNRDSRSNVKDNHGWNQCLGKRSTQ